MRRFGLVGAAAILSAGFATPLMVQAVIDYPLPVRSSVRMRIATISARAIRIPAAIRLEPAIW
jgi:hypothetical protein